MELGDSQPILASHNSEYSCFDVQGNIIAVGRFDGSIDVGALDYRDVNISAINRSSDDIAYDSILRKSFQRLSVIKPNESSDLAPICCIAINVSQDRLAFGTNTGGVHIFNTSNLRQLIPLSAYYKDHNCAITALTWSPYLSLGQQFINSSFQDSGPSCRLFAGARNGRVTEYECHLNPLQPQRSLNITSNLKQENMKRLAFGLAASLLDLVSGQPVAMRGFVVGEFGAPVHHLNYLIDDRISSEDKEDFQELLLVSAGSRVSLCRRLHRSVDLIFPELSTPNDHMLISTLSKEALTSEQVLLQTLSTGIFIPVNNIEQTQQRREQDYSIMIYANSRGGNSSDIKQLPELLYFDLSGILYQINQVLLPEAVGEDDGGNSESFSELSVDAEFVMLIQEYGCRQLSFHLDNNKEPSVGLRKSVFILLENGQLIFIDLNSFVFDKVKANSAQAVKQMAIRDNSLFSLNIPNLSQIILSTIKHTQPAFPIDAAIINDDIGIAAVEVVDDIAEIIAGFEIDDQYEAPKISSWTRDSLEYRDPSHQTDAIDQSSFLEYTSELSDTISMEWGNIDVDEDADTSYEFSFLKDSDQPDDTVNRNRWLDQWLHPESPVTEIQGRLLSARTTSCSRNLTESCSTFPLRNEVPIISSLNDICEAFVEDFLLPPNTYEVKLLPVLNSIGLNLICDTDTDDGHCRIVVRSFNLLPDGCNGPAESCKQIAIGDYLLSINGECVSHGGLENISSLLKSLYRSENHQRQQEEIVLRFQYGDTPKKLKKPTRRNSKPLTSGAPFMGIFGIPALSIQVSASGANDDIYELNDEETFSDTFISIAEGISADSKDALGMVITSIDSLIQVGFGKLVSPIEYEQNPDVKLRAAIESLDIDAQSRHLYGPAAVESLFLSPRILKPDFSSSKVEYSPNYIPIGDDESHPYDLYFRPTERILNCLWNWRRYYHSAEWNVGFFRSPQYSRIIRSYEDRGTYTESSKSEHSRGATQMNLTRGRWQSGTIPVDTIDRINRELVDSYEKAALSFHKYESVRLSDIDQLMASSNSDSSSDSDDELLAVDIWRTVDGALDANPVIIPTRYEQLVAAMTQAARTHRTKSMRKSYEVPPSSSFHSTSNQRSSEVVAIVHGLYVNSSSESVAYAELKWYLPPYSLTKQLLQFLVENAEHNWHGMNYNSKRGAAFNRDILTLLDLWMQIFSPAPGLYRSKLHRPVEDITKRYALAHGYNSAAEMKDSIDITCELISLYFLLKKSCSSSIINPASGCINSHRSFKFVKVSILGSFQIAVDTISDEDEDNDSGNSTKEDGFAWNDSIALVFFRRYDAYLYFDAVLTASGTGSLTATLQSLMSIVASPTADARSSISNCTAWIHHRAIEARDSSSMSYSVSAKMFLQDYFNETDQTTKIVSSTSNHLHLCILLSNSAVIFDTCIQLAAHIFLECYPSLQPWHLKQILLHEASSQTSIQNNLSSRLQHLEERNILYRKYCYNQYLQKLIRRYRSTCFLDQSIIWDCISLSAELRFYSSHLSSTELPFVNQGGSYCSFTGNIREIIKHPDVYRCDHFKIAELCYRYQYMEGVLDSLRRYFLACGDRLNKSKDQEIMKTSRILEEYMKNGFIEIANAAIAFHSVDGSDMNYLLNGRYDGSLNHDASSQFLRINELSAEVSQVLRLMLSFFIITHNADGSEDSSAEDDRSIGLLSIGIENEMITLRHLLIDNTLSRAYANSIGITIYNALGREVTMKVIERCPSLLSMLTMKFYSLLYHKLTFEKVPVLMEC